MEFRPIARGYYLEGLSIDGDVVWFTDVIPGGVRRRLPDGRIDEWLPGRMWIGCIVLNEDGCVLSSGPGGITWFNPKTDATGSLIDSVDGRPLDGVNEMIPDSKGGLIFGTLDAPSIEKGVPPKPASLYRLDTDGRVTCLADGFKFSNGLAITADGKRLYHNETFVGTFAHEIAPDGSLGKPTLLLDKFDADGMALDRQGRLWVTGYRSNEITCLRPDGRIDRRIALPAGGLTNIRFGGADARDLYLTMVPLEAGDGLAVGKLPGTQDSILYHARSDVPGRAIGRTRFELG